MKIKILGISLFSLALIFSELSSQDKCFRKYGFAQMQGHRPTMEDAHAFYFDKDFSFFGLYDGHGGKQVADFASIYLHKNIYNNLNFKNDIKKAIHEGFVQTHHDLNNVNFDSQRQGCTAVTVIIKDGMLYVGNLGDSRAVLCKDGKAIALTVDHKPDLKREKERIEKLGGYVIWRGVPRVNGRLAISRALGDKALNPYVSYEPEIFDFKLSTSDEFLILACDGVWDVLDNQEAVDAVRKSLRESNNDFDKSSEVLRDLAFAKGSTDNISAIVISLK